MRPHHLQSTRGAQSLLIPLKHLRWRMSCRSLLLHCRSPVCLLQGSHPHHSLYWPLLGCDTAFPQRWGAAGEPELPHSLSVWSFSTALSVKEHNLVALPPAPETRGTAVPSVTATHSRLPTFFNRVFHSSKVAWLEEPSPWHWFGDSICTLGFGFLSLTPTLKWSQSIPGMHRLGALLCTACVTLVSRFPGGRVCWGRRAGMCQSVSLSFLCLHK